MLQEELEPRPPRGPLDIGALRSFVGSIGSKVGPDLIQQPGKELYHYTDLGGLIGILENGDLWLSHSRYCNDEEEMAHGQRVVSTAITDALARAGADAVRQQYLEELRSIIDQPANEGVYICCFCQRDNLLSQWRGYGANGAGVSLQFDSSGFSDVTGEDCTHGIMRFWRVIYKPDVQRNIMDSAIDLTFDSTAGLSPLERAHRAADAIQFFIPAFKNQDFEEEMEWRLIFTPHPGCLVKPKFRPRGSMLVPFYKLRDLSPNQAAAPFPSPFPLPITHATVGPSANKFLNTASVKMMFDALGYPNVVVEASRTSFRS